MGGKGDEGRLLCSSRIQFPDPQSWYHTNQVMVTGTVDCVLQAREQLLVSTFFYLCGQWITPSC